MHTIRDNVEAVRQRVGEAAGRAGRNPGDVTIVAVTKTFPAQTVREVIAAGIQDIGENRVQEMTSKAEQIRESCRWHLVGPLQRNKARKVIGLAHLIQAVDGVGIAQTIDRIAGEKGLRARVLLEVNTSGEASKHGIGPAEVVPVADQLTSLSNLDWLGLMTIGPLDAGADAIRVCFRSLARLAVELRGRTGLPLPELSMGMSDDFEMAIEEGATIVRLGRVITGERK